MKARAIARSSAVSPSPPARSRTANIIAFIEAGGYTRPEFWLSLGWTTVQEQRWEAPLYWQKRDGDWWNFTLSGFRPVDESEPVTHISYFEADAYANWDGARLPTEFEWERASAGLPIAGNFVDEQRFHPAPALAAGERHTPARCLAMSGNGRAAPTLPYPGYRAAPGALGEYNGKFMCNQMVLRGGSCATSRDHIRATYRNFFQPEKRWQFTGSPRRDCDEAPCSGGHDCRIRPPTTDGGHDRRYKRASTSSISSPRRRISSRRRSPVSPLRRRRCRRSSSTTNAAPICSSQICELPEYYVTRIETRDPEATRARKWRHRSARTRRSSGSAPARDSRRACSCSSSRTRSRMCRSTFRSNG